MDSILQKLEEKNDLLERFFRINEEQIVYLLDGKFSHLPDFYESREGILKVIGKIDNMLEEDLYWEGEAIETHHKKRLLNTLDLKENLIRRILGQDLQILSLVEEEKSRIIKNLRKVQGAKTAISKFHSGHRDVHHESEY